MIVLRVDEERHTATLVRSYEHKPEPLLSTSQGDAQFLPDGHVFVGWGSNEYFTEFARDGRVLLDGKFGSGGADSYRAYRFAWAGHPSRPAGGCPRVRRQAGDARLCELERRDERERVARAGRRSNRASSARTPPPPRAERPFGSGQGTAAPSRGSPSSCSTDAGSRAVRAVMQSFESVTMIGLTTTRKPSTSTAPARASPRVRSATRSRTRRRRASRTSPERKKSRKTRSRTITRKEPRSVGDSGAYRPRADEAPREQERHDPGDGRAHEERVQFSPSSRSAPSGGPIVTPRFCTTRTAARSPPRDAPAVEGRGSEPGSRPGRCSRRCRGARACRVPTTDA